MEINNNAKPETAVVPKRKNWIKCEVCNIYVTSQKLLELHQQGKKHQIMKKKIEENVSEFRCHVCNIRANGKKQLMEHLNGKIHKMKIEDLRDKEEFNFFCMYGIVVTLLLYIIVTYTIYLLISLF